MRISKSALPVKAGTRNTRRNVREGYGDGRKAFSQDRAKRAFFEGVGSITVAGPYNVQGPGDTQAATGFSSAIRAAPAEEQACAEKIISNLAHRAYRRPVTADDLPQLLALYRQGADERRLRGGRKIGVAEDSGVARIHFPHGVRSAERGGRERLPDQRRRACIAPVLLPVEQHSRRRAARGRRARTSSATRRSWKARSGACWPIRARRRWCKNFAGQWLFLRNIARIQPDPAAFPNFDENLRQALEQETELLVESTLREDRSVVDLLTDGLHLRQSAPGRALRDRGAFTAASFAASRSTIRTGEGLLGQASILTVTSYPNRTAPTIRGKWVLEQLLGTPPPPPPPNVPSLKEDASTQDADHASTHGAAPSQSRPAPFATG